MKFKSIAVLFGGFLTIPAYVALSASGLDCIDSNTNLNFYGDLRLRFESDWDSHQPNGVLREDRNRGRIRARFGLTYTFSDEWSAGARIRTGNHQSQQSPHLTFASDSGGKDDLDFVPDRYFLQFKQDGFSVWGGRNNYPIWQQTELFWDDDVTPTGVAGTCSTTIKEGKLNATLGAFYLPDGGYGLNGQMLTAGADYSTTVKFGNVRLGVSLNYLRGEDDSSYLRNRNGERDYLIGTLGAQLVSRIKAIPVTLGADVFNNFADYDAADVAPFPATDTDERLGYVFSIIFGRLQEKFDWLVGYHYAHIETFSANASYAQDDWIRFGSGAQTDSSDFEGHEFRVGFNLSKQINLIARLYLVDAITTGQDGNRFRVDLNMKF